ncbi:MAG: peptidylprolyl isomerase [bacterium]
MLRRMRKKKFIIWTLWAVVIAFIGTIFLIWGGRGGRGRQGGRIEIAQVNGEEISRVEYQQTYKRYSDFYRRLYGDRFEEVAKDLPRQVVDDLIREKLLLREAKRWKIAVSDREIVAELQESFTDEEGKFNQAAYNRYREQAPHGWWRNREESARDDIVVRKLEGLVKATAKVTETDVVNYYQKEYLSAELAHIFIDPKHYIKPEEIKTYFQQHRDDFKTEEKVKASHILVKLDEKAALEEEAKVKEKIDGILAQIKAGADFADMAKKYSECPSGPKGGDLGFFGRGQMVKEFEEAAFGLSEGELSEPVKTKFGYHIIRLEEKKPGQYKELEEVREKVIEEMVREEGKGLTEAEAEAKRIYKELKAGADFETMAQKFSHGKSASKGGKLGVLPKGSPLPDFDKQILKDLKGEISPYGWNIDRDFAKAAFSLSEGEISEPVKTKFGYHIIRLEKLVPPPSEKLKDVRKDILTRLRAKKESRVFDEWYNGIKAEAKIEINPLFFPPVAEDKGDTGAPVRR